MTLEFAFGACADAARYFSCRPGLADLLHQSCRLCAVCKCSSTCWCLCHVSFCNTWSVGPWCLCRASVCNTHMEHIASTTSSRWSTQPLGACELNLCSSSHFAQHSPHAGVPEQSLSSPRIIMPALPLAAWQLGNPSSLSPLPSAQRVIFMHGDSPLCASLLQSCMCFCCRTLMLACRTCFDQGHQPLHGRLVMTVS